MADIVRVKWLDHCSIDDGGWNCLEAAKSLAPVLVDSVGFLIAEHPDRVVLAAHMTDQDSLAGDMCILRSCIKSMRVIRRDAK